MADEFDQYKVSASSGDEFAQYKVSSPVESPISPPPFKMPQQPMSQSPLGRIDMSDPSIPQFGGMHGGSYDIMPRVNGQIASSNSPEMGAAALGGTLGVAGAIATPKVIPAVIKAVPYIAASEAINLARQHLPLGKYIPQGAEMLPFFMSGGKGKAPDAAEGEVIPAPALEGEGQSVPLRNLPIAKGNPYAGSRTPQTMELAQSTNIGLHGYHPESKTMLVQFANGRVYEYRGVPEEVFNAYRNSESQGSFFANNIKGRYETNFRGTVKPTAGSQARKALGASAPTR